MAVSTLEEIKTSAADWLNRSDLKPRSMTLLL